MPELDIDEIDLSENLTEEQWRFALAFYVKHILRAQVKSEKAALESRKNMHKRMNKHEKIMWLAAIVLAVLATKSGIDVLPFLTSLIGG